MIRNCFHHINHKKNRSKRRPVPEDQNLLLSFSKGFDFASFDSSGMREKDETSLRTRKGGDGSSLPRGTRPPKTEIIRIIHTTKFYKPSVHATCFYTFFSFKKLAAPIGATSVYLLLCINNFLNSFDRKIILFCKLLHGNPTSICFF